MKKEQVMGQVTTRLRKLFARLAAGQDVAPTQRLRLEGMLETLVLLGLATEAELDEAIASVYRDVFKTELRDELGSDWRQFHPFPQVPGYQQRAPVFPSTSD